MRKYCSSSSFHQVWRTLRCNFNKNEVLNNHFSEIIVNTSGTYRFLRRFWKKRRVVGKSCKKFLGSCFFHCIDTYLYFKGRGKSKTATTSKMELKALHLESFTSPRSTSAIGFIKKVMVIIIVIVWKVSWIYPAVFSIKAHFILFSEFVLAHPLQSPWKVNFNHFEYQL